MTLVRDMYLDAAESVASLIAQPQVAQKWDQPSALAKLTVRGLAGHLAGQVFFIANVLEQPSATQELISLHEYYARVSWIGSDIDDPFNVMIRDAGEKDAAEGNVALAARVADTVGSLRTQLPRVSEHQVHLPNWSDWSITLDDFIASRLLEIVVHSDDLAYSVGIPTPALPAEATELVVDVLSRIAIRRHGAVNVLRALSRSERAPSTISGL